MEYLFFAVCVLLFVLLLFIKGYLDYRREEKRYRERLYTTYGTLPVKEYHPERFAKIPTYFEKHQKGFLIDDITWNDLNMDEVFKQMDSTLSAAGEEYLYYTLRTPSFDTAELMRKEELISFFRTHEEERVFCQFLCHKLGYTGKYSIYDYLEYLDDLGERKNGRHYLALCLAAVSVLLLFVNLPTGLLLLLMTFIVNILSYFKTKGEIDPYITSFSYIFRLLDVTDRLCKKEIPAVSEEWKRLRNAARSLASFKKGAFLLMSPTRMNASGNPIEIVLDYLRMTLHLDLIQFNRMLSEVRNHVKDIDTMLTIMGQLETVIAIGAYREGMQEVCVPVFGEEKAVCAKQLYHPLIKNPVKNDIAVNQGVLITGSNASGKSTFLKTVAVNAILAQTIHTCMAETFQTNLFRIFSSMSLRDDIEGGDSYYMVEIKALKRIMDELKKNDSPVLCFVDEVLRGTNTVERIAASAQILKSLCQSRCLCFAATHDIELTHLLEKYYQNYHFEEEIEDNDISFSYKIMDGRAGTRNAIKLLGIMGYDTEIVLKAEQLASDFLKSGKWQAVRLDES